MKLKNILFIALAVTLTLLPALPPHAAFADAVAEGAWAETRTPLVVIRFSQRNVLFERALQNALTKAISTKRDVMFDVTLKPGLSGNAAGTNLNKVIAAMREMGVPPARIHPARGPASGEKFDEVHIYVR